MKGVYDLKERLLKTGWVQKLVRVREEYIDICLYLEFYANKMQLDKKKIFDEVFTYSISYLLENGFKYKIEDYPKRRTPKGFLVKEVTLENLNKYYEFYKEVLINKECKRFYFCEFIELLIYIYCMNHLDKNELKLIDSKFGITIKEWFYSYFFTKLPVIIFTPM